MKPALALAVLTLAGCADTPGRWSAYVYPNGQDRSQWERTDRFRTESMCKKAAKESIAKLPEPQKAAYSCVILQPI